MSRFISLAGLTTVALVLTACVPNLGPAPRLRTPEMLGSSQTIVGRANFPADRWWVALGDPQLDALEDEALKGSPDVASAASRFRAAEAITYQAGATRGPTASVDGFVGGTKQSYNLGIPPQFVPKGILDTGRLTANFGYDLDLFGRNRAALAAATSDAQAAEVDAAEARLTLTTAVAGAYADLARYYAERDVAVDALRVREATATLTAQRVQIGVDNRGSQDQAESRVPTARADVLQLDESILTTQNRLAALVGAGPDRGRSITRPRLMRVATGVPLNAGIALIGRRPDIVAARLRTEAAAHRIRQARAAFYPNINLTAIVGLQSLGLGNLLKGTSSYGNAGPAISLPIFNGGQISGRYRGARADFDGAVATYDSTLITALQDVADSIARRDSADARAVEQARAIAAAQDASRIARLRYVGGLTNQLTVLTTDDTLLSLRRALVDVEAQRIALDVGLIRALGGGYRLDPNAAPAGDR